MERKEYSDTKRLAENRLKKRIKQNWMIKKKEKIGMIIPKRGKNSNLIKEITNNIYKQERKLSRILVNVSCFVI